MAWFCGQSWKIWLEWRLKGVIAVEDGELIWPKKVTRKQILVHVGERKPYEPALITCEGECSNEGDVWTWHKHVKGASYRCDDCGKARRWGLPVRLYIKPEHVPLGIRLFGWLYPLVN